MARAMDAWLLPLEEPRPGKPPPARLELPFDPVRLETASVEKLVASCEIDHTVPPALGFPGGVKEATARATRFVRARLGAYATDRNDPSRDGTSHLSPYLHFGMISARKVALLARAAGEDGGVRESADAFLEQLLVRRGLAYNFARSAADHTRFSSIPAWAKKTLAEHERDPRPALVTLEDLTLARSPDALWNAAQLELRTRGVVHGYARMLWGKLPLTWMRSPEKVHEALVHLNDRFALDGRDPDGYASIGWCFGLHDRPWPSRPIFGAVRCMTSKSARSKLDFEDYIEGAERWR
jgi:deoxyribodipyrimidine photo-lyase